MQTTENPKVAILGASQKPNRYAHKAQVMLMEHGYDVIPVNPALDEVLGVTALDQVPESMDTVTVYLSEKRLLPILEDLVNAAPRRVIFNPGAESETAQSKLKAAGIDVEEACTLVLLTTDNF